MGWLRKTYTKMVAASHTIVGFPETEVFTHPNYIRGGISKLEELTEKWVSGEISFADATQSDIRDAERNPERHPRCRAQPCCTGCLPGQVG